FRSNPYCISSTHIFDQVRQPRPLGPRFATEMIPKHLITVTQHHYLPIWILICRADSNIPNRLSIHVMDLPFTCVHLVDLQPSLTASSREGPQRVKGYTRFDAVK